MSTFPSFEAYVEAEHGGWRDEAGKCRGCMREAPRLTKGIRRGEHTIGDGECEWCLRYHWGYDQGEARAVAAILGGAVRGALKDEMPATQLTQAVTEAIESEHEREISHVWNRYVERAV